MVYDNQGSLIDYLYPRFKTSNTSSSFLNLMLFILVIVFVITHLIKDMIKAYFQLLMLLFMSEDMPLLSGL